MDADGYPTDDELNRIKTWPIEDFGNLIDFIVVRWAYPHCIKYNVIKEFDNPVFELTLVTGGWSGNESLIYALLENRMFCMMWYYQWNRGGKYIFRINPRNVGYKLVRDYCKENGISRQYVSAHKNKYLRFKMDEHKIFIKKLANRGMVA